MRVTVGNLYVRLLFILSLVGLLAYPHRISDLSDGTAVRSYDKGYLSLPLAHGLTLPQHTSPRRNARYRQRNVPRQRLSHVVYRGAEEDSPQIIVLRKRERNPPREEDTGSITEMVPPHARNPFPERDLPTDYSSYGSAQGEDGLTPKRRPPARRRRSRSHPRTPKPPRGRQQNHFSADIEEEDRRKSPEHGRYQGHQSATHHDRPRRSLSAQHHRQGHGNGGGSPHYLSPDGGISPMSYVLSRPDLTKAMRVYGAHLHNDLHNPEVLQFLHKHQQIVNLVTSDEYKQFKDWHDQRKNPAKLKQLRKAMSAHLGNGHGNLPHPANGEKAEKPGVESVKGATAEALLKAHDAGAGKALEAVAKLPLWKRPGAAFAWGLLGTGIAVGGSVPTMAQAHGYAAQARAQQQSANAASSAMIHNGTMNQFGNATTLPNGTVVSIPQVNSTTKHYSRQALASWLRKRASIQALSPAL